MSMFDKIIECEQKIIAKCASMGVETHDDPEFAWLNKVYKGDTFRRAHIDSVDARNTKGLYMTHICVFPTLGSSAPIYGFDIICGSKKVTGAFHDYSPTVDWNHDMVQLFADVVSEYEWSKPRQLPDWAQAIFSPRMVAAGNIQTEQEMDQVCQMALDNLDMYFDELAQYQNDADYALSKEKQNRYCHFQKQNPHTPKVMASLGLDPDDVNKFIHECLFPEID